MFIFVISVQTKPARSAMDIAVEASLETLMQSVANDDKIDPSTIQDAKRKRALLDESKAFIEEMKRAKKFAKQSDFVEATKRVRDDVRAILLLLLRCDATVLVLQYEMRCDVMTAPKR